MPRRQVARFQVQRLQILDEDGNLDRRLDPKLDDGALHGLYRAMVLAREVDGRMLKLQRQGRLGTFPLCTGQEAASCAAALAMGERDWLVPAFREVGGMLMRGYTVEHVLTFYAGREEGSGVPPDRRVLPISVPVGSQILHAPGLAYAMRMRGEADAAVVAFFGDGATSEGDFHEGLNFAGVWKVPVVFVCQNNQWAISLPRSEQTASQTIAQKAIAYGMPGIQVDGNDPLAVYAATAEALARARAGEGPTLIEAVTHRLLQHTTSDDPTKYRTDGEVEAWWRRDPIPRFRRYLEGKGLWDEAAEEALLAEVRAEVDGAVSRFEADTDLPPDLAFDHALATGHPNLDEQRDELLGLLASEEA